MTDELKTPVSGAAHLIGRLFIVGVCTVFGTMLLVVMLLVATRAIAEGMQALTFIPILFLAGVSFSFAALVVGIIPSVVIWSLSVWLLSVSGTVPPVAWHVASGITAFTISVAFQLYFILSDVPLSLDEIARQIGLTLTRSLVPAIVALLFSVLLLPEKIHFE